MSREAVYRFLPWARRGLQPAEPDSLVGRTSLDPTLPVTLDVGATAADGTEGDPVAAGVDLRLYGPGDVVGINRDQVVRTVPTDGTRDFEPNYFPSVEFAQPDLAWLFSPARAHQVDPPLSRTEAEQPWWTGRNLRPWLSLVVVPTSAATFEIGEGDRASGRLTVPAGELPSPRETWAWAHVQVVGGTSDDHDAGSADWVAGQLTGDSALATCRLVCPRALAPDQSYRACVVPTFDAGREAGLGREPTPGDVLPAWSGADADADAPVTLPVYYSWEFRTGPEGDFEALVSRLRSAPVPPGVGYTAVDVREPIPGTDRLALAPDDPPTITFAGALTAPGEPADRRSYPSARRAELRELLTIDVDDDGVPVVGPPVYGGRHAGRALPAAEGDAPEWLYQLNVDPEHRAVAGLGARVIRENQEQLMDRAWEQVGQLREANRAVSQGVLGSLAGRRLHDRLAAVDPNDLKRLTAPFHDRLPLSSGTTRPLPGEDAPGQTVREFLARGPTPRAALSSSFTRQVRRGGGPGRLLDGEPTRTPAAFARRIDAGELALAGQRSTAGGRPLPPEVADTMRTVIDERAARQADRERRHGERLDELDVLVETFQETRVTLDERAATLETISVVDPGPVVIDPGPVVIDPGPTSAGTGFSVGSRLRNERRIEALGSRELPSLSTFEVRTDTEAQRISGVLSEITLADLETSFGTVSEQPLVNPARIRIDIDDSRATLTTAAEEIGTATLTLGEYSRLTAQVDAVATGELDRLVTTVTERPESFADLRDIRRTIEVIDETIPALERLREGLAETPPPEDRVVTYYRRLWDRHYAESTVEPAVSISPRAAASADRAVSDDILTALDPARTVRDRLAARLDGIDLPARLPDRVASHPAFDTPMYEPLVETALRYFLPDVEAVPNNSLTLVETNPAFVESYLVGLNHEFARELRWREFPTDMRGSYFRQFWDTTARTADGTEPEPDIDPIHEWRPGRDDDLGDHLNNPDGDEETLVLLVRGDLLRRYPNTQVYAERARWVPAPDDVGRYTESATDAAGRPLVREPVPRLERANGSYRRPADYEARHPILSGRIQPDITFLGLPLTATEARGDTDPDGSPDPDGDPGWFVILEEPAGESQFGLDAAADPDGSTGGRLRSWRDLTWDHVTVERDHVSVAATHDTIPTPASARATWGRNSAHLAHITWQRPFRVAVHADDMLPAEEIR